MSKGGKAGGKKDSTTGLDDGSSVTSTRGKGPIASGAETKPNDGVLAKRVHAPPQVEEVEGE